MDKFKSRKKKLDNLLPEWPKEVKFRPTEHKDITHAYEYISCNPNKKRYKQLNWIL